MPGMPAAGHATRETERWIEIPINSLFKCQFPLTFRYFRYFRSAFSALHVNWKKKNKTF